MRNPEIVIKKECMLGEGTWWDAKRQILYWFDGFGQELYEYDPSNGENKTYHVPSRIGCAIPTKVEGVLVMCLQDGVYTFNTNTSELRRISAVECGIENNRLNDGLCDSLGTLWFGSMSMTANQPEREFEYMGSFYSLTPKGELRKHFDGVGISNGIAFNRDETTMYYVDTMTGSAASFDVDIRARNLSNRKTVVEIAENEGIPDGMTIDTEGMLWVAHFGGGRVSRWDPSSGRKLSEIYFPAPNVTCCCFGGSNLNELYVTTARAELSSGQLEKAQLSGSLFRVTTDVTGKESYQFGVEV